MYICHDSEDFFPLFYLYILQYKDRKKAFSTFLLALTFMHVIVIVLLQRIYICIHSRSTTYISSVKASKKKKNIKTTEIERENVCLSVELS